MISSSSSARDCFLKLIRTILNYHIIQMQQLNANVILVVRSQFPKLDILKT